MGGYDPMEPLARLIEKLEKGREFERVGGKTIPEAMMVFKWIRCQPLTMISECEDDKSPTSRHGPLQIKFPTNPNVNKGKHLPP